MLNFTLQATTGLFLVIPMLYNSLLGYYMYDALLEQRWNNVNEFALNIPPSSE